MRRVLAILCIAPLTGCGAHLHHAVDDQLAQGAMATVEGLDWDQAFARDRAQRDALAERDAELGRAYAEARREAELLDVLTEPVGERSWAKFEERFIALAACMLDEPGTGGGRACRGGLTDAEREAARALLFDACPEPGCAWVEAVVELGAASKRLADQLASYDRARGEAELDDSVASLAQCPVPTRLPAALREQGQRLEQACASYDDALAAVAAALPETSELRHAIDDVRALTAARDGYREELRSVVAELSSLRFDGRFDVGELEQQVARYLALQAKYAVALAGSAVGDFADLALEGTLMITREHRAAIMRTLGRLGERVAELVSPDLATLDDEGGGAESFRSGGSEPPPGAGPSPSPRDPEPEPEPPRPEPRDPVPPRPLPDPTPSDPVPPRPQPEPPPRGDSPPASEDPIDREYLRTLGASLAPVFGETWQTLHEQERGARRGSLLLSAEIERIQLDAMARRLGLAEDRVWLELGAIETQLFALLKLRLGLERDWIAAADPGQSPQAVELERLRLELELAAAALALAEQQLEAAIDKFTGKSGKPAAAREPVAEAKQRVQTARASVDEAADNFHRHLATHGASLCRRQGSVSQTYERDVACVDPIERLVGLHAEFVGVGLPRLEALDRSADRRKDEATLLRDQAGLEIRITYIAASVAALQRFTAGGLEARDVAAIVGAVVGIGLGAAITAGVYIP